MAGVMLPISVVTQYFTNGNQVLAGGTINTYTAGTTTPINTYTDSTLGTSNGTSLTLDTYGRPTQEMWVAAGTSVKVIIKDSSGNQLGPTLDNLTGLNDFGSGAANKGPYYAGAAGGTANALTFTFSSGPASYVGGQITEFTATATNNAAATYNTNGLGSRAIQNNGAALVGGEIINGNTYMILDTGSAGQLLSIVGDPVTIKGSQTVTGAKTFTNGVIMSGSPVTFANRVDVASVAGTTVFDGTLSNYLRVTGTNTITAITLANGSYRHCVAGGAFSITTGASLVITGYPSGTTVTFASGDTFDAYGEASSVVRITNVIFSAATPNNTDVARTIVSGNISTSGDTTMSIPSGAWKKIEVVVEGLTSSTDYAPYWRVNADTGANYDYATMWLTFGAGTTNETVSGATAWSIYRNGSLVDDTPTGNNPLNFILNIINPAGTANRKTAETPSFILRQAGGAAAVVTSSAFRWNSASAITSLTLLLRDTIGSNPTGSTVNASGGTYFVRGFL